MAQYLGFVRPSDKTLMKCAKFDYQHLRYFPIFIPEMERDSFDRLPRTLPFPLWTIVAGISILGTRNQTLRPWPTPVSTISGSQSPTGCSTSRTASLSLQRQPTTTKDEGTTKPALGLRLLCYAQLFSPHKRCT